jgi:ankyrin repeat protein
LVGEKEAEHNAKTKEGVYLPIHLAAFKGNNDILQFLLKKYLGDISDIKSAEGINLLHAAAQGNQPEMIDYLVNVKNMQIDGVDSNGWSALHCAADCNSLKAVKKLLELGANKDLKNKKGHTPLQIAQDKKYEEIINLLSGSYPNKLKL